MAHHDEEKYLDVSRTCSNAPVELEGCNYQTTTGSKSDRYQNSVEKTKEKCCEIHPDNGYFTTANDMRVNYLAVSSLVQAYQVKITVSSTLRRCKN